MCEEKTENTVYGSMWTSNLI